MAFEVTVKPATPARWRDIEELFGPRGACAGCWCMWWRLKPDRFAAGKAGANKRALRRLVQSGARPGLLAYDGARPVGWCAIAPRQEYPTLARSRVLAPVDDLPVWSVTCFFVARSHRRKGITVSLLEAAVELARRRGARIVEGYPVEPRRGRGKAVPDLFAWTGLAAAFRRAGFKEVERRSETRPIMRRVIPDGDGS